MTEERMIRIEVPHGQKRVQYRIEIGDSSSPFGADVLEEDLRARNLEIAPPKDWKEKINQAVVYLYEINQASDEELLDAPDFADKAIKILKDLLQGGE